jgi:predicted Zn-dependent protease
MLVVSSRPNISVARRLEYARGYLALDLADEAVEELSFLPPAQRDSDAVLEIMLDVHGVRKDWKASALAAEEYVHRRPEDPKGWISWAYATRRLESITAAEKILLQAEMLIGETCALVHYNLACYRCQLGDNSGALQRLTRACQMEAHWKIAALSDPDLARLKNHIATLPLA